MAADHAAVYDDLKSRILSLGMRLSDFAETLGLSSTTMPKWRSIGTPPYATNYLILLETYTVPAAIKAARGRPAATMDDALKAIRPAASAVVDDAIKKGWSRQQIADSLRTLADECDGGRQS